MKTVTVMLRDKPVIQFETEIDDFAEIMEMLYSKYEGEIWLEIKNVEKGKVKK